MLLFCGAASHGQPAAEAWVRRYSSEVSSGDFAFKIVADSEGNVIVAGYSADGGAGGQDMLIIKYSGEGIVLWTNGYSGPVHSDESAPAMAVGRNGNVFVAVSSSVGSELASDRITIAYSAAGTALWTNHYNSPDTRYNTASAIAVDQSGNVFVTGIMHGVLKAIMVT